MGIEEPPKEISFQVIGYQPLIKFPSFPLSFAVLGLLETLKSNERRNSVAQPFENATHTPQSQLSLEDRGMVFSSATPDVLRILRNKAAAQTEKAKERIAQRASTRVTELGMQSLRTTFRSMASQAWNQDFQKLHAWYEAHRGVLKLEPFSRPDLFQATITFSARQAAEELLPRLATATSKLKGGRTALRLAVPVGKKMMLRIACTALGPEAIAAEVGTELALRGFCQLARRWRQPQAHSLSDVDSQRALSERSPQVQSPARLAGQLTERTRSGQKGPFRGKGR